MIKKITAIIRPEKLDLVKDELEKIGCNGITVSHVKGRGKQVGLVETYRGNDYRIDLISKEKIEIVTTEDKIEKITNTIVENAKTDHIGDGKIFISDVSEVIRIRTGEKGENAL